MRCVFLAWLLLVLGGASGTALAAAPADNVSRYGSIGLQVVPTATGELVVLQIPPGTPSAASEIRPGDLIVSIDDYPLAGSDFAEVVSRRLWGVEGSSVVLRFLRPGEAGVRTVTLRRAATDPKLTVTPTVHDGAPVKGGKR